LTRTILGLVGIRRLRHRRNSARALRQSHHRPARRRQQRRPDRHWWCNRDHGAGGDQWLAYHVWTTGAIGYDNAGTRRLALRRAHVVGHPAACQAL